MGFKRIESFKRKDSVNSDKEITAMAVKGNRLAKFVNFIFYSGLALSLLTAGIAFVGGLHKFAFGMAIWFFTPYVIFKILVSQSNNENTVRASGIFLLVADILAHVFVFYFMHPEAGAMMILLVPFWLFFVLIAGFTAGWVYGKLLAKQDGYIEEWVNGKLTVRKLAPGETKSQSK